MTSAANDEAYANRRYGGPWGHHDWRGRNGEPFWMPPFLMGIPKPVLIILMILGFIFWWPIGLGLLALMLWRRHAMCGGYRRSAWQQAGAESWSGWKSWNWCGGMRNAASSGNHAFDEYRAETLKRLEEEQKEFAEFLERLRFAKDKSEFDQFMKDRRTAPPDVPQEQPNA
ncbi:MAG: DUF2852 domain-containing protein [Stellaceae bacterium]